MVSRIGYGIRIFRATIASRATATRQIRINSVLSTMVPIASEPSPELNQAFSYGQTIQTGAFFCGDGSGGVRRVWRDRVLHSVRGSGQNCGGAGDLCNRGEGGRRGPGEGKVANRRCLEHDGSEVFQATGVRRTAELGPGFRERLRRRVQENASTAVTTH